MDTSYLSSQVSTIIDELHGLFDEIGVPSRERESRESELFAALSETLHNQVRLVATEKDDLTEEAHRIITTIKQMEASLEDDKDHLEYESDDDLKLHKERFEQVKKLVQALESYSSHLEPSYIQIELPPTSPDASVPPTFDLSNNYVSDLDDEFTRVYEEYNRRVALVKATAENIIQLWAELGTPQAQTDSAIVKYYRDAPEQLGLHEDDISRLRMKQSKLLDEKKGREKRLRDLRTTVEALWVKLGVEEPERKRFLNSNRGCGMRQINEFEDELSRLNELKRQNLHLFVEDARYKLQELWDDVYSDALLEAHEQEIERLEALKEQRAPTLALIDEHQSLVKDRDDLQSVIARCQSPHDAWPEGRKAKIEKGFGKIGRKNTDAPLWFMENHTLINSKLPMQKPAPGPRSKTPAGPPPNTMKPPPKTIAKAGTLGRSNSAPRPTPPNRSDSKTPTAGGTLKRHQSSASVSAASERNRRAESIRPESRQATSTIRGKMGPPPSRAPPPKMLPQNTASGSENWETYGDVSETEPEEDTNEDYFARLRAARANRYTPDDEPPQFRGSATVNSSMMKKQKGYPLYKGPAGTSLVMIDCAPVLYLEVKLTGLMKMLLKWIVRFFFFNKIGTVGVFGFFNQVISFNLSITGSNSLDRFHFL
ncbi:hypothetical protein EYC84_008277 [Monilinia fructicola]|uniref:Uncharacterized protein n=1 Tax=Monilinia fructicola TaxID=38448 RepID=A0A5M9JJ19_MONFR|nr:hypothetical protein EYC84_008277 [Monilinia fructicola]